MIERISELPSDVLAFRIGGQVSVEDYQAVLMPPIREAFERGDDLRVYVEIGHDFVGYDAGAVWEDLKAGVEYTLRHRDQWKKIALVTELPWLGRLVLLFGWMSPGDLELFTFDRLPAARHWVSV
jgi:hypothetical protein